MITLLLTLCLSTLSQADSLILVSGEKAELDQVPRAIFTSLQDSGVAVNGEESMRSLKVTSLQCKLDAAGETNCSFSLDSKEERLPVKDENGLFQALRALKSESGLSSLGSCAKDGSCEFELSSVTCMMNARIGDEVAGKYGCGLVTL